MMKATVHEFVAYDQAGKDSISDPLDLFHQSGFRKTYSHRTPFPTNIHAIYHLRESGGIDTHVLHLDVLTSGEQTFLAKTSKGMQEEKHVVPSSRVILDMRYDDREVFSQQTKIVCYKNLPVDPNTPSYDYFELKFDDAGILSHIDVLSHSPRHDYNSATFDQLVAKGEGILCSYSKDEQMREVARGCTQVDLSGTIDAHKTMQELLSKLRSDAPIDLWASLKLEK